MVFFELGTVKRETTMGKIYVFLFEKNIIYIAI